MLSAHAHRHVRPTHDGIRNPRMIRRDAHELDRRGERAEYVQDDEQHKHARRKRWLRHEIDEEHVDPREGQPRPECIVPRPQRPVSDRPSGRVVPADELTREVDENSKRKIGLAKAFFNHFEAEHRVVCLEADLGDKVYEEQQLDVAQLADFPHDAVDLLQVQVRVV